MRPVNFECAIEITKAYEDEGRWIVEGYAATSDFDMQEDIITEEAISASAKDLLENSTVLHNHNADEAIGTVLESQARPGGLFLKILISKTASEIWQQVKEGVLNKFSVRGTILEARKEWVESLQKFARLILKMRLVEVSLVAVPANPKARAIRWYVEKALTEFEKAGGQIETKPEGGADMKKDETVVEEELLEATGDPANQVDKEWTAHVALVDQMIAGEKDDARKRMLTQIRTLMTSARKGEAQKDEPTTPANGAPAPAADAEKKAAAGDAPPDKLAEIEGLITRIAKTLGIEKEGGKDKKPALAATVDGLAKRVEALEKTPGVRTSLDGQEALAGERNEKSVWKGLI
ncbi:MAG: HK97 family phage prohead protease [Planctomycetes bacterium]|nr:HK97 family phage prohead protease [Planctomycetota bacterium]